MFERLQVLTREEKNYLHGAAMSILQRTGVVFHSEAALAVFREHGVRVEGRRVHPTERQIMDAAGAAPRCFTIEARDPAKNITVGQGDPPLVPGYGAPFVTGPDGIRRPALMEDYQAFCKLNHTSKVVSVNNFMVVEPSDLPPMTAYLDMLLTTMLMSDKPFMSCPLSRQALQDNIEMANILFGGSRAIMDRPVMFPTINPLSPLQFADEMAEAIIGHARWGQPVTISNIVQGGASGPVRLAGLSAVQIAEITTGLLLAQLVKPGTPFIYGNSSCPMDMRTGGMGLGSPETAKLFSIGAQMAEFYGLPNRVGGSLTDSHLPDIRAGIESALLQFVALAVGADLVVHSCGILSSYLSMSREKYLIDEEMCAMILALLRPVEIGDRTVDLEAIHEVGPGGQHLTRRETFQLCRSEYYSSQFMHRQAYGDWRNQGLPRADQTASLQAEKRLAEYAKPDLDPAIEKDLRSFVEDCKRRGQG